MNISIVSLAISVAITSLPSEPIPPIEPTVTVEVNDTVTAVTLEEYVARVIAHEVPYTYHEEALKAQAVAARTYLYYCLETGSHPHESGADVCTNILHCCGYTTEAGLAERFGKTYSKEAFAAARAAAMSTKGEILTYNGEPLLAVWHASSGGYTENSGEVWINQLPYLRSVASPEEPQTYTVSFPLGEVEKILKSNGYQYNKKPSLRITRNTSGRCRELTLGNITLKATEVRRLFSIKSTDFRAWIMNGRLYFYGKGYGHGVGMSQVGAQTMAQSGKTYREILMHYYTDSTIE